MRDEAVDYPIGAVRRPWVTPHSDEFNNAMARARAMQAEYLAHALGAPFRALSRAIKGWSAKRSAHNRLMQMSDRMINDIGLSRADIDAMDQGADLTWISKLSGRMAAALKTWNANRKTRAELLALDARILDDIGLTRADVDRRAAMIDTDLLGVGKMLGRVRLWVLRYFDEVRLRHQQFEELTHMDDRQLADIGIARCDIWSVVYEGRDPYGNLRQPANCNHWEEDGRIAA